MEELLSARLILSEAAFREYVYEKTAALAIDRTTWRIIYATPEAERLFGSTIKDELSGKPFVDLIPERFRKGHWDHVERYLADPQPRAMGEKSMALLARRVDGEEFSVAIALYPWNRLERLYIVLILVPRQQ